MTMNVQGGHAAPSIGTKREGLTGHPQYADAVVLGEADEYLV